MAYSTIAFLVFGVGYFSLRIWNTVSYRRQLHYLAQAAGLPMSYESSDDFYWVTLGKNKDSNREILQKLQPPLFVLESYYSTVTLVVTDQMAVPVEQLSTVSKVEFRNDPLSITEIVKTLRRFPNCKRLAFRKVDITPALVAELENIDTPLVIDIFDQPPDGVFCREYGKHTVFWLFAGSQNSR